MTTIDQIHDLIDLICEKERNGFFSPERKDQALDFASMERFSKELPVYGMNEVINECLTPFKRPLQVTNSSSPAGLVTLPEEYEFLTSIIVVGYDNVRRMPTYKEIEVVNDDELGRRLRSQIRPVTVNDPIAQRIALVDSTSRSTRQQIQFYPKAPTACMINYLKRPAAPKFDYTLTGPDERTVTFNAPTSINLEWKESDLFTVILGAIQYLGINLDSMDLVKYSQMKTQGQ